MLHASGDERAQDNPFGIVAEMLAEYAAGAPSAVTEHVASPPTLTDDEIRERMSGAYNGIVDATKEVAHI